MIIYNNMYNKTPLKRSNYWFEPYSPAWPVSIATPNIPKEHADQTFNTTSHCLFFPHMPSFNKQNNEKALRNITYPIQTQEKRRPTLIYDARRKPSFRMDESRFEKCGFGKREPSHDVTTTASIHCEQRHLLVGGGGCFYVLWGKSGFSFSCVW